MGLGVTDSLSEAQNFAAATGIGSFPVVWSESFDPAALLGIFSHPSWVLLSPSGEIIEGGIGGVDTATVLQKAAAL